MNLHLVVPLFAVIIGCILCLLIFAVYLIVRLLVYVFARKRILARPFCYATSVVVFVSWLLIAYAYWIGRFQMELRPTVYENPSIPAAFDGYKIVHISDLHLSTFFDRPAALQTIVDTINAQAADLICFTGDLVSMGTEEAFPFCGILQQLHATDGVLSVLGNHDLMIYKDITSLQRIQQVDRLVRFQRDSLNWIVLRDTSLILVRPRIDRNDTVILDSLTILGVDNCSCEGQGFRSVYHGNLSVAMKHTSGFRILLSHDPTLWRAEVETHTDIPLTLSGHTHSGQLRLFGHPLAGLFFREVAGWYETIESPYQALYVNSGIGCTLPLRLNCPAEITVITLQK